MLHMLNLCWRRRSFFGIVVFSEVDHIVINDYDKAIYSIWRAIIENTNQFVELIENTEVSIDEWYRQKNIYTNQSNRYSVELALQLFFLIVLTVLEY